MSVVITNMNDIKESLRTIPERLFDDTKQAFVDATFKAHKTVSATLSGGGMESRTGLLKKSMRTSVTGTTLDTLRASLYSAGSVSGTPVIYARIHEYGGTITAKNAYKNVPGGPYLNIPTSDNKTAAGVMRKSAKTVFDDGGFIAKFSNGNGYGVFLGEDLMFVLKREVEIPARLGMMDACDDEIPGLLEQLRNITI